MFPIADRSRPLLGVIADSGQLTRLAVRNGADFLLALSAGFYRNQGLPPATAFLAYRNNNEVVEHLVRYHVVPGAGAVPVIAGLLAGDPLDDLAERLRRLRELGTVGLTNYPSATLTDGNLRTIYADQGCTHAAEIDMLRQARTAGMAAIGFVGPDPAAARDFAAAGLDGLILTTGLTREIEDIQERRDRLQHAIRVQGNLLDAVRSVDARVPCFAFGGPITSPEDLELLLRQVPFDGFVGGSVFGRLPIESSVTAVLRRFRAAAVRRDSAGDSGFGPLIGATPAMRRLFRLVERAASVDLNVCIEGESGTGKELVATQIHRLSRRVHGPLVTLNCGAIPDNLVESELFGHEKGAFTGADRRRLGKFELASGGTLFLDEVGDLSPHGQVALLRAIQQREIVRVGGETTVALDCRILAASNQPLARLVDRGRFRADLFYRLNNLTLVVPPLRQRLDDLPLLVPPILAGLKVQMNRELTDLSPRFHARLRRHSWPGNIRELQHVLAQAALLEDGTVLEGRHFTPQPHQTAEPRGLQEEVAAGTRENRRRRVRQALLETGGNKSQAADALGITRKTLYAWLRDLEEERT